ncbi:UvrD-helicase domain-containing protein [Bacillus canaveralius]|uniref:UvrD-helicase domain-containing protein n=1 Tax=Bacillus canaveralius TaxID=1403243 RepID=UPI0015E0EE3F|nr:UvrD-helicase domain-containing protein [Bacillus canaveralius]
MNDHIIITSEDIAAAEKILLNEGSYFDKEEKVPIISCMDESIDVIACPGSGKTTTLLAKLCILSEKMPFNNDKGIAVITHTNVAIEEIKNKLGNKSDILFSYPNFFGTIHSFVDKYLAIPFYKEIFKSNIVTINDDIFNQKLTRKFRPFSKLGKFIYACVIRENKGERPPTKELSRLQQAYLTRIYMDLEKGQIVFKVNERTIVKNPDNELYKELFQLFYEDLIGNGVLRYRDSYFLGRLYIQKHPEIKNFFSSRFKYVFLDETQDNSSIQHEILNSLFEKGETIIQRFGDPNQAIYENVNIVDPQNVIQLRLYEISNSMRYSQSIANLISPLRVINNGKELVGITSEDSIVPHMIIYDSDKISEVKGKFVELIKEFDLKDHKHPFKAVGWVGYNVNPDRLTIESYFPNYVSKKKITSQIDKNNFHICLNQNTKRKLTVGNVYKGILEFCSNYFDNVGIKVEETILTKSQFEKLLKENYNEDFQELRKQTYVWSKLIFLNDRNVYSEVNSFLKDLLKRFTGQENFDEAYFDSLFQSSEANVKQDFEKHVNTYSKDGINVMIDTIHGVKGETHTATLYLETFYKTNDIKRIMKFLLNHNSKKPNQEEFKSLKMAYVGMSRATKLLCIAIDKESISKKDFGKLNEMVKEDKIVMVNI